MKKGRVTGTLSVKGISKFQSGIFSITGTNRNYYVSPDFQEVYTTFADCVRREKSIRSLDSWKAIVKGVKSLSDSSDVAKELLEHLSKRLEERVIIEVQSKARIDQAIAKRNERKYGKVKY